STSTWLSSTVTFISLCSSRLSVPFGPLTVIVRLSRLIVTPLGTAIGLRPIRDILSYTSVSCLDVLPHVADNFAAGLRLASSLIGHQALGCRNNRDTEASQYSWQLSGFHIDT